MGSIQDAVRQLAKTLDEQKESETHEPTIPATPTLLGIPLELRTRIYEYALCHEEGGGVICPIHTPDTSHPLAKYDTNIVLKAGKRWTVRDGRPVLLKLRDGATIAERHEWFDAEERLNYFWEMLPTCQQQHFCSFDCLKPPPLTKVSGQVHNEALPVFYAVNKFHFEMDNFRRCTSSKSPAAWWRAIGDTNLRFIRKLNLFCHEMEGKEYAARSIMVRYRKPAAGPQLTRMPEKGHVIEVLDSDEVTVGGAHGSQTSVQERKQEREERLRSILGVIAIDELHVRALENVMFLLMPELSRKFLPDLTSLEEPQS